MLYKVPEEVTINWKVKSHKFKLEIKVLAIGRVSWWARSADSTSLNKIRMLFWVMLWLNTSYQDHSTANWKKIPLKGRFVLNEILQNPMNLKCRNILDVADESEFSSIPAAEYFLPFGWNIQNIFHSSVQHNCFFCVVFFFSPLSCGGWRILSSVQHSLQGRMRNHTPPP